MLTTSSPLLLDRRSNRHSRNLDADSTHRYAVMHGTRRVFESLLLLSDIQQCCDRAISSAIVPRAKTVVERGLVSIHHLLFDAVFRDALESIRAEGSALATRYRIEGRRSSWLFVFNRASCIDHVRAWPRASFQHPFPGSCYVCYTATLHNASMKTVSQLNGMDTTVLMPTDTSELVQTAANRLALMGWRMVSVATVLNHPASTTALNQASVLVVFVRGDIQRCLWQHHFRHMQVPRPSPRCSAPWKDAQILSMWEASLDRKKRHESQVLSFLSLLGFLHWNDIFLSLFDMLETQNEQDRTSILSSPGMKRPYILQRLFTILQANGVVEFQSTCDSYNMHRQIHDSVRNRQHGAGGTPVMLLSINLLREAVENAKHRCPQMKARLLPHLMSNFAAIMCLNHPPVCSGTILDHFRRIARFATSAGRWSDARVVENAIYERLCVIHGRDHVDTLSAQSNLASAIANVGELQTAVRMQQEVVEKMRLILGDEHSETLAAMNNLAVLLADMGELRQAELLKRDVLQKMKRVLGGKHSSTLSAMNNLAATLSDLGKLREAIWMKRDVLVGRRQILGENHPETLSAMSSLAATLGDVADWRSAVVMERKVLQARRRILGEDHPDTISALNNLAITKEHLGEQQWAMEAKLYVYRKRQQLLGEDHPDTLSALSNLAHAHAEMGWWPSALEMQSYVVNKRRRVLGDKHPDTLSAMSHLAHVLGELGKRHVALVIKYYVLEKRRQTLGEDHPHTHAATSNFALTLGELGDLQGSLRLKQETVEKTIRVLGKDHPDTLSMLSNLAITLEDLGQLPLAMEIERDVLQRRRRVLGENHPETIAAMNNLGITLESMGKLQEAVLLQRQVVQGMQRNLGNAHLYYISAVTHLTSLEQQFGAVKHLPTRRHSSRWRSTLNRFFSRKR